MLRRDPKCNRLSEGVKAHTVKLEAPAVLFLADCGTVPLDPAEANDQNNSIDNPGTPYNLPLRFNVPFAPTTVMTMS
jgi:hypothetical protein